MFPGEGSEVCPPNECPPVLTPNPRPCKQSAALLLPRALNQCARRRKTSPCCACLRQRMFQNDTTCTWTPPLPPRLTRRALRAVLERHITDLTGISGVCTAPPGLCPGWLRGDFWVLFGNIHGCTTGFPEWGKRGILSTTAVVSTARTAQVLTTTWVKLSRNTPVWRKKAGFTINYLTWCSLHTAGDEGRSTNYEFSLMDISPKLFPVLACGWRTGKKRYAGHAPQHAACLCC